jgi:NADH dehydrogenase FAD-containing subunit
LAVVAEAEALVVVLQVVVGGGFGGLEVEDSLAADLVEAGKIFKYKPLHLEKRAKL